MIRKAATARKRKASTAFKAKRREWSSVKGVAPKRDPAYLDYIRSLGCVVCGTKRGVEAAHVGDRGLRQKCSDYETAPLCGVEHHRLGKFSHHVLGKRFWAVHGLNREMVLFALLSEYRLGKDSKT